MKYLLALLVSLFATSVAYTEADPQGARQVYLAEMHALGAKTQMANVSTEKVRRVVRASYAPDPKLYAMAKRVASEVGVPMEVVSFHIMKESGWRADARNPKSTATGLLQLIKGSHEAISGQLLTKEEHFRLARDPERNLRLGVAHIKACMELMPGASADRLWRSCHVKGHAAAGGRIEMATAYYKTDQNGWLARGSVAMPWSNNWASLRDSNSNS